MTQVGTAVCKLVACGCRVYKADNESTSASTSPSNTLTTALRYSVRFCMQTCKSTVSLSANNRILQVASAFICDKVRYY
jgi:hypothetical protein